MNGFCPSELLLPYDEWHKLANERRDTLRPATRDWLYAWGRWDLACSPMDDEKRRQIRYGHYLGWHAQPH